MNERIYPHWRFKLRKEWKKWSLKEVTPVVADQNDAEVISYQVYRKKLEVMWRENNEDVDRYLDQVLDRRFGLCSDQKKKETEINKNLIGAIIDSLGDLKDILDLPGIEPGEYENMDE